jgi:hypothetical protein
MWFGAWLGTQYTGQWWGDGGFVPPPPPAPAVDFPLGLKNVAWRPLKAAPVVVQPAPEREPQPALPLAPEPQDVPLPQFAPLPAPAPQFAPLPVDDIERQVAEALRGELARAKADVMAAPDDAEARARQAAVERAFDRLDEQDDIEALAVLMHII